MIVSVGCWGMDGPGKLPGRRDKSPSPKKEDGLDISNIPEELKRGV